MKSKIKRQKASKKQRETILRYKKKQEKERLDKLTEYHKKQYGLLKNQFIKGLIQGNYFLSRCNMIADQLNTEIKEMIDGYKKTKELMCGEYDLDKMKAIDNFSNSTYAKIKLMEDYEVTNEELEGFVQEYHSSKILREKYDEEIPDDKQAKFVKVSREQAKKEHQSYMG